MPSFSMPRIVGRMISRMARACTSAVTTGAGEYAPMPPVLGPSSPSLRRLWSWLVARASTFLPSHSTMKEASSPSRNSSITTRAPPSLWVTPYLLSTSMKSTASWASCSVMATTTPLPAARPSALMTMGAPSRSTNAGAADAQAIGTELIDHTGRQWRLGAHHRQCDLFGLRPHTQFAHVGDGHVLELGVQRGAAVARRHVHLGHLGGLAQFPRHRVFTAAATNHKYFHRNLW